MDSFDLVDVLSEFSKSMRHSLISIESLNGLEGVDPQKVADLACSVRHLHEQTASYLASLIDGNERSSLRSTNWLE